MKLLLTLLVCVPLASCGTGSRHDYSDSRFYPDAESIFGEYDYQVSEVRNTLGTNYFYITIDEAKFNRIDLNQLQKKIESRGWVFNYSIPNRYWVYCKDKEKKSLKIYAPNADDLVLKNGDYLIGGNEEKKIYICNIIKIMKTILSLQNAKDNLFLSL